MQPSMEIPEQEVRRLGESVVAHLDMDCFYVQVEQRLNPALAGKPVGLLQYTKDGAMIALSYEAKRAGVKRGMTARDARARCPDIQFARVAEKHGKADLSKYRRASQDVFAILTRHPHRVVERISIDEAYVDITEEVDQWLAVNGPPTALPPSTMCWGTDAASTTEVDKGIGRGSFVNAESKAAADNAAPAAEAVPQAVDVPADAPQSPPEWAVEEQRLVAAGWVTDAIRAEVASTLRLTCSVGIATNKIIAKLATGFNKPDGQAVVFPRVVPALWERTPTKNVRSLGGKEGERLCGELGIVHMADVKRYSIKQLAACVGSKRAEWLYYLAYGLSKDPVSSSEKVKSIGCSKTFPQGLTQYDTVCRWLAELAKEISERTTEDAARYRRHPTCLVMGCCLRGRKGGISKRKSYPPNPPLSLDPSFLSREAVALYDALGRPTPATSLSLGLGNMVDNTIKKSENPCLKLWAGRSPRKQPPKEATKGGGAPAAAAVAAKADEDLSENDALFPGSDGAGDDVEAISLSSSARDGDGSEGDGDVCILSCPDTTTSRTPTPRGGAPPPPRPPPRTSPPPRAEHPCFRLWRKSRDASVDSGVDDVVILPPQRAAKRRKTTGGGADVIDLC
eukprot:TRINITY_DN24562_c0_g1_i1.p1 TRINITY_DN24562_c0_g1~~TRINITY_DN24562_c0_g1_i1.p1  ORF type:complete len:623 (+),score=178.79 TRINITY_DN24562_c0_g1_i1:124-1992(+)